MRFTAPGRSRWATLLLLAPLALAAACQSGSGTPLGQPPRTSADAPTADTANGPTVINVVAQQWAWTFNYNFEPTSTAPTPRKAAPPDPTQPQVYDTGTPTQPPVLFLPVGRPVQFVLTSPDVIHSFYVPDMLLKVDIIPGRINHLTATPTTEGIFAGKCAELCGSGHSHMLFTVKVVSPAAYHAHLQDLEAQDHTGQQP